MQYYAIFDENELKTMMYYLNIKNMPYIVNQDEYFLPNDKILQIMVEKKMLMLENDAYRPTEFVAALLNTIVYADCVVQIELKSGLKLFYYYLGENIVFSRRDTDEENYCFYLVSLVPQMIGSLGNSLEYLQPLMPNTSEIKSLKAFGNDPYMDSSSMLLDLITVQNIAMDDSKEALLMDCYVEGKMIYSASLSCTMKENWVLAVKDNPESISYTVDTIDYYKMIEIIGRQMIRMLGHALRLKGDI